MERIMKVLAPHGGRGVILRVLCFVAMIAATNVAFALLVGPHIPQSLVLYQLISGSVVATPFTWFFFSVMLFQVRLQRRLSRLSRIDGLTGLNNRSTFLDLAARRNAQSPRCILLLLDADHFKQINDTYGHQAGDNCLQSIAYMLKRNLRDGDVTGRIGGEEFAILMANATMAQAQVIAERLTRPIPFRAGPANQHLTVTLSVGAVATTPDQPLATFLAEADRALYQAKAEGRARVIFVRTAAAAEILKLAV